ncbi:astacin (Peptidase family m12A) domain-containing protein [Phthorimaea operculella]|nr:astacin (Peptidase family m12A) domain-containing protein [Phthorimaea operculella]
MPRPHIFVSLRAINMKFVCTCELVIKEEISDIEMMHTDNEAPNNELLKDSSENSELPEKISNLKDSIENFNSSEKISKLKNSVENLDSISKLSKARPISRLWTEEEIQRFKLWPRGVMPYYIDDFSFDKVFRDRIRSFLEETTDKTGLQFLEMPSPPDNQDDSRWVFFINRRAVLECPDVKIGDLTNTGAQRVVLGYDCLGAGGDELAATILALAGVPPQHNAPDRDKHIEVLFDNIMPEKHDLFRTVPNEQWPFKENFKYDFESAGHYDFFQHTKNGKQTIKPVRHSSLPDSDVKGLSPTDISKLRFLYDAMSQKPKANISKDCSKMFKLGSEQPDVSGVDTDVPVVDTDVKPKIMAKKLSQVRGKKSRGLSASPQQKLKGRIEGSLDFDTDADH